MKAVRVPGAVESESAPKPESPLAESAQAGQAPGQPVAPTEPAGIVVKETDPAPTLFQQQCDAMAGLLRRAGWTCEPPRKVGGQARPKLGSNGWEVPTGYG